MQYLACPSCDGELRLDEISSREGNEILTGAIGCTGCNSRFTIVRGVPRFADLATIDEEKVATAASFGWQWQHFTQDDQRYADQLLAWLSPVTPDFFRDKVVLEGGCGKGRHTVLAGKWGARDVVAVDISDAVESAFAATRGSENLHVVQADLYHLPLRRAFDYAFSVGVVHHLPKPAVAFRSLASKIKRGGHFSVWVYGAENNQWITRFVSPIREGITARMSPRVLLQLSKLPAALVYAATKLVYGPLSRNGSSLSRRLFYGDYLTAISHFGWREQHTIVFDHLVAPTSHYISRDEFESWWRDLGAADVHIEWVNKNSWSGFGQITN